MRTLRAPSYSPVTGLYFLGVNSNCMNAAVTPREYVPGRWYLGLGCAPTLAPGDDFVG